MAIYCFGVKDNRVQTAEEIDVHNPDTGYTLTFKEYLQNMAGIIQTCRTLERVPLIYGKKVDGRWTSFYIEGNSMRRALDTLVLYNNMAGE